MDWMHTEQEYREWCELSWEDRKARFCEGLFVGMAFPATKSTADGGTIRSEIVEKFPKSTPNKAEKEEENRKREKREHANRLDKLTTFYHNGGIEREESPFEEN